MHNRGIHRLNIHQRGDCALQRCTDERGIAADQHHGAGIPGHGCRQRRKVLALAFATQNQHHLAVGAQALQRGHGGPHIRALAVVKKFHAVEDANGLHAVGLATVLPQAKQNGAQRATGSGAQSQRGQCVAGVVATADTQHVYRHQALEMQLLCSFIALAACLISLQRAHQPDHAVDFFDAEVAGALGHVGAKRRMRALHRFLELCAHGWWQHRHHGGVVTVQHHQAGRAKDACLGTCISLHVAVPVQMVLGHIEHNCSCGLEAGHTIELEAGQLQHPDLGQCIGIQMRGQRIQQRGADIAGHGHGLAGMGHELTGQRGDGGFAIGASDGQHRRRITTGFSQGLQRHGVQA